MYTSYLYIGSEKIFYGHNHKSILFRHPQMKWKNFKKNYLVTSIEIIQFYFLLFSLFF